MTDKSAYDLTDILNGCDPERAVQVHDDYPALHFISAPQEIESAPRSGKIP